MEALSLAFEERFQEINSYLEFLEGVEIEAQSGPPRLGSTGTLISTQQQRILYSSVFLQLYNLVEATIVKCLDGVTKVSIETGEWSPSDLTTELRREWVRGIARTHSDLNYENRLENALTLCQQFVDTLPVNGFKLEKGGGGNWDDAAIKSVAARLGFQLRIDPQVYRNIRRPVRDELGSLALIRKFRNSLAHGSMSFAECGENLTVRELRDLSTRTADYLREVVDAFKTYINQYEFLVPDRRPTATCNE